MADLQAKDPAEVGTNAAVEYSAILSQYLVPFFERPFIVDVKKGEIFDQASGIHCPLGSGILMLHYLTYAQNIEPCSSPHIKMRTFTSQLDNTPLTQ